MYLNTRIFPTTGYARVLLFMFIRRELGGTGTGCLFQFTYCEEWRCQQIYVINTSLKTRIKNKRQVDILISKLRLQLLVGMSVLLMIII